MALNTIGHYGTAAQLVTIAESNSYTARPATFDLTAHISEERDHNGFFEIVEDVRVRSRRFGPTRGEHEWRLILNPSEALVEAILDEVEVEREHAADVGRCALEEAMDGRRDERIGASS